MQYKINDKIANSPVIVLQIKHLALAIIGNPPPISWAIHAFKLANVDFCKTMLYTEGSFTTVKGNKMATYNGWTNYATWRVNLEIFDGSEGPWDHHSAKEFAEEIIYSTTPEGVARDYALAFLSDVNWYEIADHYQDENAEA